MIHVTRLNHTSVVLNSDLIEHIEVTPDTVISLTTGQKLVVLESVEELVARVIEYRHLINAPHGGTGTKPQRQGIAAPGEVENHG